MNVRKATARIKIVAESLTVFAPEVAWFVVVAGRRIVVPDPYARRVDDGTAGDSIVDRISQVLIDAGQDRVDIQECCRVLTKISEETGIVDDLLTQLIAQSE